MIWNGDPCEHILHSLEEGQPEAWPAIPGLSDAAALVDKGAVWQRLEAWIDRRWPERPATFVVQGNGIGAWMPTPRPFSATTIEEYIADGWTLIPDASGDPGPFGWAFPTSGVYRLTGTLGDDDLPIPPAVLEAARRLAEFFASTLAEDAAAFHVSERLGDYSRHGRPVDWQSKGLVLSGAADLLRPWRDLR